ncbi:hypothetical protein ACLRDC_01965 [Gluconacetobacter sacchari]|uniref:hypothetical protein n=1 Tax=Gluconacetobacter sacchari TaxID=92759 RepID=UPI0039B6AFC4
MTSPKGIGIIAALCMVTAGCAVGHQAAPGRTDPPRDVSAITAAPLVVRQEGSFFVGGTTLHSHSLASIQPVAPEGSITVGQMYVQYQIPLHARENPIVFVHGCCLTGKTWETTPDGRMGWNEFFTRAGFATYVVDQPWRGRSATDISPLNAARLGAKAADLPPVFAASHESAWTLFRFGPTWPAAFADERFPLSAIDALWAQMVPDWTKSFQGINPTVRPLATLAARLGHAIIVSHSQSGIYPFQAATLQPEAIAGIIAIEPGACPPADPLPAPFRSIPILIVFGDHVIESPHWAPKQAQCRTFAQAVQKSGGNATLLSLPDAGIHGNTHMMMQDLNSLEIANLLIAWIEKNMAAARAAAP